MICIVKEILQNPKTLQGTVDVGYGRKKRRLVLCCKCSLLLTVHELLKIISYLRNNTVYNIFSFLIKKIWWKIWRTMRMNDEPNSFRNKISKCILRTS